MVCPDIREGVVEEGEDVDGLWWLFNLEVLTLLGTYLAYIDAGKRADVIALVCAFPSLFFLHPPLCWNIILKWVQRLLSSSIYTA